MTQSVRVARGDRELDSEVMGNHCRGFTAPIDSLGDRHTIETAVARAAPGPTITVECQYPAGERVVYGVQSTHRVDPTNHRCRPIVDLVGDIHVKPTAGFFVVLVTRHDKDAIANGGRLLRLSAQGVWFNLRSCSGAEAVAPP